MVRLSVVMSVYNGERYLKEAILSVLNQTYSDFEFIIINDGSNDGTSDILSEFAQQDLRIKVLTRENKGLIYSLNEGVNMAKGEYIARMDADDICLPNRFEKIISYMDKNSLSVCGSWAIEIDENGKEKGVMDYPPGAKKIKSYLIRHNPFIHPSVIFRKSDFLKVGNYKNYVHVEDYELWTRMVYKFKADNVCEPLIKYRIHQNQVTKKNRFRMMIAGVWVRILATGRYLIRF